MQKYAKLQKEKQGKLLLSLLIWRRHPDLNWGIRVLQTHALPLGYDALFTFS